MSKQEQPPIWCESMEDARNRAVQQLESLSGPLGPHYTIHTGNLGYPPGLDMPDTAELRRGDLTVVGGSWRKRWRPPPLSVDLSAC